MNGIGRATPIAFATKGASVVEIDISEKNNEEAAKLIVVLGEKLLAIKCDVTNSVDIKFTLDKTIEQFGRLDFAYNNTGIEFRQHSKAEITEDECDHLINIDLRVFRCMKYQIPIMLKYGGREIIKGIREAILFRRMMPVLSAL